MTFKLASFMLAFASLRSINARCSHGLAERGLEMHNRLEQQRQQLDMQKRQAPTDLAQQEQIIDPSLECTAYNAPVVSSLQGQYPPIWQIASLVSGDTEAADAYNAIINNPGFPNYIQPRGTPAGDFSGVQYNNSDPDCWWSWSKCTTPKLASIPSDVSTCPEPSTWGLSLDDGPNCTHNALYDYLQENAYTASLFYIGSNVMDWPYQAQRGLKDGHDIGVHTWSHRYATALTNEQFFAELWYTRKAIKAVVGITPTTWRPPYGDIDDRIRFIANAMNLTTVIWDHDTFDWQIQGAVNPSGLPTASVVANYNEVIQDAQQGQFATHGAIVLTHELNGDTMELVMQELPSIAKAFQHVVPVTTCRNITHPYIEQNYTFPTFQQWLADGNKASNTSSDNTSSLTGMASTMSGATRVTSGLSSTAAAIRPANAVQTSSHSSSSRQHVPAAACFLVSAVLANFF